LSLFALISLIVSISCALLAIFTFIQAKNKIHQIWGVFNADVALWCMGLYFVGISQTSLEASFYWKLAFVSNTFISALFYHLIYSFCQLKERRLLFLIYLQALLFSFTILFSNQFVNDMNLIFGSIFFPKDTLVLSLWLFTFALITGVAFQRIWQFVRMADGEKKTQSLYLFWGMLVGFVGGFTIALPIYGIPIYPGWHFLICIYAGIFTFSILRHRFLDIRVGLIRSLIPVCILTAVFFVFCFFYFEMTLFSMASLSVFTLCTLLAFIVFAYSTKKVHTIWAIFNVIVAAWGLAIFFVGMSKTPERALLFWKLTFLPCTFISIVYYHVIAEFCKVQRTRMLSFAYIQGALFVPLIIFSNYFLGEPFWVFNSIYYHKATLLFTIWAGTWCFITASAFFELHKFIKRSQGVQKTQALYLFWGMLLGHTGGLISVIPSFSIPIYPAWHFMICVYAAISTYAIFRYQIMDIKIAGARLGIFVLVYSLVLGIPFGLEILGREWLELHFGSKLGGWIPMLTLLGFATAGPFIYLYLQRRTEDALLQKQRESHRLLMQASFGMNKKKNIQEVTRLMVDLVSKILRFKKVELYLFDQHTEQYLLIASRLDNDEKNSFTSEDSLVQCLRSKGAPIVYDQLRMINDTKNGGDSSMNEIISFMDHSSTKAVMPITMEKDLLAFLVLGEQDDANSVFTDDLLGTLNAFCNQAALAIENAIFVEETHKGLTEMFQDSKMKAIGALGSGAAHQFNNRFNSMVVATMMIHEIMKDRKLSELTEKEAEKVIKMIKQLESDAYRGGEIADALLNYSKADMAPRVVDFDHIVKAALEVFFIKHPRTKQIFKHDYNTELFLWVNFAMLQDIIMTAIDNSVDAIKTKQNMIKRGDITESDFESKIIFRAKPIEKFLFIEIEDNGIGLTEDQLRNKIFTPFFTTKGATKGTGMGIPMMQKLIHQCGGTMKYESEYEKWTKLIITMPLATDQQIKEAKQED